MGAYWAAHGTAAADEVRCEDLPTQELRTSYYTRDGRSSLSVALPASYKGAKFYQLSADYGEQDNERLVFNLQTETGDTDRLLRTSIHLPEDHLPLKLIATYHQGACYAELRATFAHSRRLE
jgi:hypothetical protein